jgi:hypothetical protein
LNEVDLNLTQRQMIEYSVYAFMFMSIDQQVDVLKGLFAWKRSQYKNLPGDPT